MKKFEFKNLILWEDEDYILINKPPHLSTLDDRQVAGKQNILRLAKEYIEDAQVAHRLDKETSGVLAIAKNPDAYRHLAIQFEKRKVVKMYHAIVEGIQSFENVVVDKPILPLNTGGVKIDYEKGKEAETHFNTLEIFKRHTLVQCSPLTGRMHQIRIHLAILRASIIGDEQYGGKPLYLSELKRNFNLKKDVDELPLIQRFPLHAFQLTFENLKGKQISIEAPYPKDFHALLTQLRKFI
jgi:23S rRNA pseudouridine955/2504/2580 synthase